jgi:excisionase family DNA binding protein
MSEAAVDRLWVCQEKGDGGMTFHTLAEAADLLRLSKATLRRLNRAGHLKFTRLSARHVIVRDADLQEMIRRRTK